MLLVSHKVVFVKNEAVLQCVTMRERASEFVATIIVIRNGMIVWKHGPHVAEF